MFFRISASYEYNFSSMKSKLHERDGWDSEKSYDLEYYVGETSLSRVLIVRNF